MKRNDGWCHLCHPRCRHVFINFKGTLDALGTEIPRIKCLSKQQGSDALSTVCQHAIQYGTYLQEHLPPGWNEYIDYTGCRQYYCPATRQRTIVRPFWHQVPSDLTPSQQMLAKRLVKCLEDKYRTEPETWSISGSITALQSPSAAKEGHNAMYLDDALEKAVGIDLLHYPYAEAVAATRSISSKGYPRFIVGQQVDMQFPGGVRYYVSASLRTLRKWADNSPSRFSRRAAPWSEDSFSSNTLARRMTTTS